MYGHVQCADRIIGLGFVQDDTKREEKGFGHRLPKQPRGKHVVKEQEPHG